MRRSTTARVGQWDLVERIGTGQWSEVYAARPHDCPRDRPADYAVKIACSHPSLAATCGQLLQREGSVATRVSDPHLITVLEASQDHGTCYLVMPRLHGSTVRGALDARGRLSTAHALWVARQVAQALTALHRAGWLHGDVKPGNIMVAPTGHATLFDLGFAVKLASPECQSKKVIRGTMAYTAPEVISSTAALDQSADIYSLGITLYEMLTGHVPFATDDPDILFRAHRQRPVPNPRRVVPGLARQVHALICRMLAKQSLRRPTAAELIWHLAELEIELFDDRVA